MPIRLFGELTQQLFQAMDCTSSVDVLDVVTRMTLDTIGRAGFGFDFNSLADPANEWVTVYNDVKTALMDPFFLVFPVFDTTLVNWFPKRAQKHQQMTRFLAMLDTIIEAKRHHLETVEEEENRDLLTLMIESEQEGQATLTNEELRVSGV
jgi:cytochrome P450